MVRSRPAEEVKGVYFDYKNRYYDSNRSVKRNLCKTIFCCLAYRGLTYKDKCKLLVRIPEYDVEVSKEFDYNVVEYLDWMKRYLSTTHLIRSTKFKLYGKLKRNIDLLKLTTQ